jgi:hypothetical protein
VGRIDPEEHGDISEALEQIALQVEKVARAHEATGPLTDLVVFFEVAQSPAIDPDEPVPTIQGGISLTRCADGHLHGMSGEEVHEFITRSLLNRDADDRRN